MTDLFKTEVEMPSKNGTSIAVRTAQTRVDMHQNYESAMNIPNKDMSVENITRPRRGHDY